MTVATQLWQSCDGWWWNYSEMFEKSLWSEHGVIYHGSFIKYHIFEIKAFCHSEKRHINKLLLKGLS